MLVLTCKCGHRMRVTEDRIGKTRICSKCRVNVRVTKANTSPDETKVPVKPGTVMGSALGPDKKRIGQLLVDAGHVTDKQLKEALDIQVSKGGKVVEVLITLGYLSVETFISFLAKQPGIASIDLSNYQIPTEIISLVPKDIAIEHEVFPIDKMGKLLTLGMACPLDSSTVRGIEERTGLRVKALLCSPGDIRAAISRYYPVDAEATINDLLPTRHKGASTKTSVLPETPKIESALKLSGISLLVQELKSLPVLPDTVERVRASVSDLSISPKDVAETIVKDPPVAAKVLSVANSAAYGFPNKVDSVDLAVALMGLRETYSIVLSAAVINLFDRSKNFNYKIYWEEALNCAAASRIIARSAGLKRETGVFTAGLLHDIGRLALLETCPEKYARVSPNLTGDTLIHTEQEIIGLTHTEAGYELAMNWNLPVEIAEPIRFHHQPEFSQEAPQSVAIVALAESWTRTHSLDESTKQDVIERSSNLFEILNINAEAASEAFDEVAELDRVRFKWGDQETTA